MKTKLHFPENQLSFDNEIVQFVEKNNSNTGSTHRKVAIIGTMNKHYRTIYLDLHDDFNDLDEFMRIELNMQNRLTDLPPIQDIHAIYDLSDDDLADDDDDWI